MNAILLAVAYAEILRLRDAAKGQLVVVNQAKAALERQASLLSALRDVVRICEAVRLSAGLQPGQIERIIRAKKIIEEASCAVRSLDGVEYNG